MAPDSSPLAWKTPWTEEPGRLQSMGSLAVGHDWVTSLSLFTFMHWRREWQPTPVFLPGESQGRGSLWAAVYGVAQSRTQLMWLSSSSSKIADLSSMFISTGAFMLFFSLTTLIIVLFYAFQCLLKTWSFEYYWAVTKNQIISSPQYLFCVSLFPVDVCFWTIFVTSMFSVICGFWILGSGAFVQLVFW